MRDDELRAELIDFAAWSHGDTEDAIEHVDDYIAEMKQSGEW